MVGTAGVTRTCGAADSTLDMSVETEGEGDFESETGGGAGLANEVSGTCRLDGVDRVVFLGAGKLSFDLTRRPTTHMSSML
eukprot:m.102551 g.102551  ORF g.102551 m.102551 type:complete len:81 (+) comp13225_c0_seq7:1682-1924(+)